MLQGNAGVCSILDRCYCIVEFHSKAKYKSLPPWIKLAVIPCYCSSSLHLWQFNITLIGTSSTKCIDKVFYLYRNTYVFYQCHKLIIEANNHVGGIEAAKAIIDRPPDYDQPLPSPSNITPSWYKHALCLQLMETIL